MGLNPSRLAQGILDGVNGSQYSMTSQISGLAQAIINHALSASVAFAPGTIIGTGVPVGPFVGSGLGGIITLVPALLISDINSVFGASTAQLTGLGTAISSHIASATVTFAPGTITGLCTAVAAPVPAPGILVAGVGAGGTIVGLVPSMLAGLIAGYLGGNTSEILGMSKAICDELTNFGLVSLPLVTGAFGPGGGALILGTAAGGLIT